LPTQGSGPPFSSYRGRLMRRGPSEILLSERGVVRLVLCLFPAAGRAGGAMPGPALVPRAYPGLFFLPTRRRTCATDGCDQRVRVPLGGCSWGLHPPLFLGPLQLRHILPVHCADLKRKRVEGSAW
jgi:hypothetical protein